MGPVEAGVTLVDPGTEIRRQLHVKQARGELGIPCSEKQPVEARQAMDAEVQKLEAGRSRWERIGPGERG